MTEALLTSPFLGLTLSAAAWCAGCWLQKKMGLLLCNPLLVAAALIIGGLALFHVPYSAYALGGSFIKLMLGPVTAVLALNIYNQREILKENFLPVLAGCLAGSLTSVGSVLLLCRLFQVEEALTASLLPKSVTTAIAIAIAESRRRRHRGGGGNHHRAFRRGAGPPVRQALPCHRAGGGGAGHRRVQPRPGHHPGHGDRADPGRDELHRHLCLRHFHLCPGALFIAT